MASRESSITVAVRVRPFTLNESSHLVKRNNENIFLGDGSLSFNNNENKENVYSQRSFGPKGIRKILDVVDDRMLIFDPPENNPLANISKNVLAQGKKSTRFREHRFVFDRLFDVNASQEDVYYKTTRPLLDNVLDGYNASVFAYGATGCGKTHTISGTIEEPGIIFLTMKELFERIEDLKDTKHIEVSLSYLEIYNETIRDLMEPKNNGKSLTLREDAEHRISVSNLSTHSPQSVEDVMDMIIIGNRNRTCSPTEANATSSRSHAVLQINVTQKNRTADVRESHTFATLSIIDLAGSERAAATRNRGDRLQEGANINKSLLALGNCINALCDLRRRNHVPYRDSKLTRLLKFSLGGNCKTVMIVCVSPSSHHYDETLNTLKYADRAKEIKTKIKRNQHNLDRHVGSYLKMITEQKQEIEELRKRESEKMEQAISNYKVQRDRVSIGVLEFIDNLKQNLNSKKFEQLKLKKSLILCKRRLLLHQQNELKKFVKIIDNLQYTPSALNEVLSSMKGILVKISNKTQELERLYDQETDLDLTLSGSADAGTKRLMELETWSNYDRLILETTLSLIKDSVEKTILRNALIAFDKLCNTEEFGGNFKFASTNLFKVISQVSFLQENSNQLDIVKGEIRLMLHEFFQEFDMALDDLMNLDNKFERFSNLLQYDLTSEITIPTSPIRKIARTRASSPFKILSPSTRINLSKTSTNNTRISKNSSPNVKFTKSNNKPIKKVRWEFPEETDESIADTDSNIDLNTNSNVEVDGHDDVSMDDLAKVTDQLEMITRNPTVEDSIDQSFSELEQVLSSNKKRKSLTSKSLKPNLNSNSLRKISNSNNQNVPINDTDSNPMKLGALLGAPIRLNDADNDEVLSID